MEEDSKSNSSSSDSQDTGNPKGIVINKNEEKKNKDLQNCAICFNKLTKDCKLEYLACTHCFHRKCIFEWYKTKKQCPICKMKEPLFQEDQTYANDLINNPTMRLIQGNN